MVTGEKRYFWQNSDPLWYKDAVIYELHVRAFRDSDGDGTGDFAGLTEKLDYLQDLGVTAIWLLPFYPSPFKDDGYDISDYTGVHPAYGTMDDFKDFMREANYRGLRVITEMVLNHTSDQHPWFQRARRAAPGTEERDFYVWNDNWDKYKEARIIFKDFESSNWAWDTVAKAYYWHRFYSHQPDLNFDSPSVHQAILRVVNFWLGLGVSGLRLDAVPYLYEREGTNCENLPETHAFLKELRRWVDTHFQNRMLLAEANQWADDAVAYFGEGDECHMAYHFPLMPRMFMSIRMEDRFPIIDILQDTPRIPETSQWALFLRNHDELTLEMVTDEERDYMYRVYAHDTQARINLGIRRRLAPLLNNDRKKIELMNVLLFSLPGTPLVYYGDEIGMGDNFYLGDRNGVRTPMQWSADRNAGFSSTNPHRLYLPVNIDPGYHYEAVNVETQQGNPDSLLWWMKRLIGLRKRFKAFGRGSLQFLYPENRKVLAFVRRYEDQITLVVANLSRLAQYVSLNLAEFNGKVPVEVFGQAEFPRIGEAPYPLTLSPYAYYWFSLESKLVEHIELLAPQGEASVPVLTVTADWKELYDSARRPALESTLLSYVKQRRWFGGKARRTLSAEIRDFIVWPYGISSEARLIIVQVEYVEGEPETYLLPVTFAQGEKASQVISQSSQALIAYVKGTDTGGDGVIYDALFEKDFCHAILRAVDRHRQFSGEKGVVTASHTKAVFQKIRGAIEEKLEAYLIKGEQTNSSVVYGDRFKLKLLRRLEEGVNPELEIGRFLTEKASFPNSAPLAGVLEYQTQRTAEPVTLGVLHGYVKNEGDAWQYTLDSLRHYFERVLTLSGVEVPLPVSDFLLDIANENLPTVMADAIGTYLVSAQLLGRRTAELHLALASTADDPNFIPEPFSVAYQRSLYHGMRGFALQVLQLLRQNLKKLPDDVKADAQKVLGLEETIVGRLQNVTRRRISGMRIRCHGDYHLGQVLYTGNDFVIIDFEGEPARHLGERRIKRSPLRDIAGMIRSFHYVAYAAIHGQVPAVLRVEDMPLLEEWARAWYLWVSATFLKSYLGFMGNTPILPSSREDLQVILDTHLLDKAIYEVNYELNNRPDWVGLPLGGILQVLGIKEPSPKVPSAKVSLAKAPPAKEPPLTICPFCNTEFYIAGVSDELPPVVNVTCPNCQAALEVNFRKTVPEGKKKPEDKAMPEKRPEPTAQNGKVVIEGSGVKDDEKAGG
ncbi:MAG: maltose alpha-D-glucosyltransferase [Chloroflexi bacterium]|nr:maltose alpha-D-glucosyltransferase [Chloroflexota bacterium]